MWEKIQIISKEIPNILHNGFTYDLSGNIISNIQKTVSLKMPFKMINIKNLYNFELFFNEQLLTVYFYINIYELSNIITKNKLIPQKNNLFNILKCYITNQNYNIKFRKLSNINNIISYFELLKYKEKNKITINNLTFDVEKEIIEFDNDNLSVIDLHFYFTNDNSAININNNIKICIVDDSSNYITRNNVIDYYNYKSITKKFITNNNFIVLDKNFFLSNKYISNYKRYHSSYISPFAFQNYKNHILNSIETTTVFNIELFTNYIIIFKNIYPEQLFYNPILYSKCKKIFILDNINSTIINNCKKLSIINSKRRTNNNFSINEKIQENERMYINNSIYNLDDTRYNLYKKIYHLPIIILNNFTNIKNINKYEVFNNYIDEMCFINYTKIKNQSHIVFNCNHKYLTKDINVFLEHNNKCPQCQLHINNISVYFHYDNIIIDILGIEFNSLYQDYIDYNHIIIGKFPEKLKIFINSQYKNIIFINENCCPYYTRNTILYLYNLYDEYKLLNYCSKLNTNNIKGIYNIRTNS